MFRSPFVRIALAVIAVIAALGILRLKPWQAGAPDAHTAAGARQSLTVSFLPVT
jgi:hypothetical protein